MFGVLVDNVAMLVEGEDAIEFGVATTQVLVTGLSRGQRLRHHIPLSALL